MEQELENRTYELAYHLNSDIEEGDVRKNVDELEAFVSQNGGTVLVSREPKKKHLSYPLRHKHYSYFGFLDFSAQPEVIEKLNAVLKLQHNLMRYLVLEKPVPEKELRVLGTARSRGHGRPHDAGTAVKDEAGKVKGEVKSEQIEKEIADVLEKI